MQSSPSVKVSLPHIISLPALTLPSVSGDPTLPRSSSPVHNVVAIPISSASPRISSSPNHNLPISVMLPQVPVSINKQFNPQSSPTPIFPTINLSPIKIPTSSTGSSQPLHIRVAPLSGTNTSLPHGQHPCTSISPSSAVTTNSRLVASPSHIFVPPPPGTSVCSSPTFTLSRSSPSHSYPQSSFSTIQLPPGIKLEQNNVRLFNTTNGLSSAPDPLSKTEENSCLNEKTNSNGNLGAEPMKTVKNSLKNLNQAPTVKSEPNIEVTENNELGGRNSNEESANGGQHSSADQSNLLNDPDVQAYVSVKPDPMDTAKTKYTCNACQFSPKLLMSLVEHINGVHLKRKNISCNMCSFKTSRKKSLASHINEVHNKQKRYPCQLCDFKGARKSSLDKHLVVKHGPVYQCKHCSYSNKRESDFKGHMMIAHGIQDVIQQEPTQNAPSNRQQNESTLTDQKTLTSEQLITYDDKLEHGYCCSICKYAPSSMRYLRDHIRKVHLCKPIQCPHCDLKTKRKADLIKHIKRLHPEASEINLLSSLQPLIQPQQPLSTQIQIIPQLPTQASNTVLKPNIITSMSTNQLSQPDPLLNAAIKCDIPITLNLQYPVNADASQGQQQTPLQITLPTIDTSALLNSYPTSVTSAPTSNNSESRGKQSNPHNPTQYKKGMHQTFDPGTKCDDLILYSDNYPSGIGCSICNYAPNSLRYLRDHIRKVHLAKTYKCPHCDLKTKRRADLVRHIKRIHEDPKRNGGTPGGSSGAPGGSISSATDYIPQ